MNYDDDQEMQSIIKEITLKMDARTLEEAYNYRNKYKISMFGSNTTLDMHVKNTEFLRDCTVESSINYGFLVKKIEDKLSDDECKNIEKYIKEKTNKHNPFVSAYKKSLGMT